MKKCTYCGHECDDSAVICPGCGLDEFDALPAVQAAQIESADDWVALIDFLDRENAEFILASLDTAGFEACVPGADSLEELHSQPDRPIEIQVRRRDYEAAQALLSTLSGEADSSFTQRPGRDGKRVISSMEATQTAETLNRLKQAGIPYQVNTTTNDSGLNLSEILVDEADYDRGCDVVEALAAELQAEAAKTSALHCRECGSRNYERVPHDKLGAVFKCKDCGNEFEY